MVLQLIQRMVLIFDYDCFGLSGLICWEHTMDPNRHALIIQRSQIHDAFWVGRSERRTLVVKQRIVINVQQFRSIPEIRLYLFPISCQNSKAINIKINSLLIIYLASGALCEKILSYT